MTHLLTARQLCTIAFVAVALTAIVSGRTIAQTPTQTPTEAFLAYRTAMSKATTYDELFPFMETKGRAFIEKLPDAQRKGMFDLLKKFAGTYTDVAVVKEAITGDTAVLVLSGKDPKGQDATGTVPLTKEASGWKVGTEKWSSKPKMGD
jgi:hypothetical protein